MNRYRNSFQRILSSRPSAITRKSCIRIYSGFENPMKGTTNAQGDAIELIKQWNTDYRLNSSSKNDNGQILEVKECHLCDKANKSKLDNLWKLYINPNGSYYCFRCSVGGGLLDLKSKCRRQSSFSYTTDTKVDIDSNIDKTIKAKEEINIKKENGNKKKAKEDSSSENVTNDSKKSYTVPVQDIMMHYHYNLFPSNIVQSKQTGQSPFSLTNDELVRAKTYLNVTRGLNDETLKKYLVGVTRQQYLNDDEKWQDHVCITFPWVAATNSLDWSQYKMSIFSSLDDKGAKSGRSAKSIRSIMIDNNENTILRMKYRSLETKGLQRILPKGGSWGFFGWHIVGNTAVGDEKPKSIIITEGEYDCMAVSQALSALPPSDPMKHIPAVSLPNGCNSLPDELVQLLGDFDTIYLWMDNDKSGQDATEKFTRKLRPARCLIVKPPVNMQNPPKDANDALRQSEFKNLIPLMLMNAKGLAHRRIDTFNSLRSSVANTLRFSSEDIREGSPTPSLPLLEKLCKGFRRSELVVLTGPTGCGKTTLLTQLSLDFAQKGAPTLWGSFEVKNERLLLKMLHQYAKVSTPLDQLPQDKLNQIMDDFEALPVQFMNFYGSTNIDSIFEAMEYAVDKDDIQHIIIDNLQFLMPRIATKSSFEKFDFQDFVIDRFRKFASEKKVNVIVVIHPRKEEDGAILGISSIGGNAKASQEADVVLILQNLDGKPFLDVRKNRYDGSLGRIPMKFDRVSMCFEQVVEEVSNSFSEKPMKKLRSVNLDENVNKLRKTLITTTPVPVEKVNEK